MFPQSLPDDVLSSGGAVWLMELFAFYAQAK